tara:strand:+ start:1260 stop:2786 length:1527 start_codon:yes stop_codon:yes gene_type:complete
VLRLVDMNTNNLHLLERKLLQVMSKKNEAELEDLVSDSGLTVDQIRRSVEWLKEKNLIEVKMSEIKLISLGKEGQSAKQNGLPEKRLVENLKSGESVELSELPKKIDLNQDELSAALGYARSENWIKIFKKDNKVMISKEEDNPTSRIEELLNKISEPTELTSFTSEEQEILRALVKRPDYILYEIVKKTRIKITKNGLEIANNIKEDNYIDALTPKMLESGEWRNNTLRPLNVESPAPTIYSGKKHPVRIFIDEVREIFVSLGFQEVEGSIVQSSFWNFDALFTPQDHPAREIQDTFYIENEESSLKVDEQILKNVEEVHKNGANTGSKGWRYNWNIEQARRMVMRTHTTCVSVRNLADNKPDEARVFSVGRVFRNEKVTFKNLVEFHQIEGIVVGKDVTLRDLMGLLTKFYKKLGFDQIKFWPSFFPYTEPSLQSMVYHKGLGKWIELGGMGIFRPEVTKPLGVDNPVLAWGSGLERLVMLRYGIDDVRKLYENDLDWLRGVPLCP